MTNRSQKLYISDMIDSIQKIMLFIKDMDYNSFCDDDKTISAVIRKIEIIGEASKNMQNETKKKNTHIPWNKLAQMRDKIIHAYFGIDTQIIWQTITNDFPNVLENLLSIYNSLNE